MVGTRRSVPLAHGSRDMPCCPLTFLCTVLFPLSCDTGINGLLDGSLAIRHMFGGLAEDDVSSAEPCLPPTLDLQLDLSMERSPGVAEFPGDP